MKNNKIIMALLLLIVVVSVYSCKKSFVDGINSDPTKPTLVSPDVALTATETQIAYTTGGIFSRYNSLFVQHITGTDRQHFAYYNYILTDSDFDNVWGNMYSEPMNNLSTQIKICEKAGYKYYIGVSKILMAYSLGLITDMWGSAPYSEAFNGVNGLKPKYDSQEKNYSSIDQLLSDGIGQLNAPSGSEGGKIPSADDFIFNGDVAKWKKFANALKARFYLHTAKVNGSAYQKALDAINAGAFASSADDAQFGKFYAGPNSSNPLNRFLSERPGDIMISGFLLDTAKLLNDPRYANYESVNKKGFLGAPDAPVYLMTYFEQKFIVAEANNRLNNASVAQTAFTEAITASMKKCGVPDVDIAAYLLVHGTLNSNKDIALKQIMFQKYVAMFLQPESWNDWRRTGLPALKPIPGAVLSAIPRSYLYPLSEKNYNGQNVPKTTLLDRVWWDK